MPPPKPIKPITITFKGPIANAIKNKSLRPILEKNMRPHVSLALENLTDTTQQNAPKGATEILVNSIMPTLDTDGLGGRTGTPHFYGAVQEFGRRPSFIPIGPLTFWARRKLGLGPDEAKRAAFAISRHYSTRKMKGQKYFARARKSQEPVVIKLLNMGVEAFVRDIGGKAG